ncbi:MAG: hypothetical protein H0X66_16050 [Verrucomicrobia bacterium]|nr:hypothetical protein [Verrucomicrobiota bacterium]
MNKIKLVIATMVAIGSLGLASAQAVNALSSPRASEDRIPVKKESCQVKKQGCAKAKSAECGKAEKACSKKADRSCCKK